SLLPTTAIRPQQATRPVRITRSPEAGRFERALAYLPAPIVPVGGGNVVEPAELAVRYFPDAALIHRKPLLWGFRLEKPIRLSGRFSFCWCCSALCAR